MGFEALSRGAEGVLFVEEARPVIQLLLKNAEALRVKNRIEVLAEPVERARHRLEALGPFDVVFADPPYAEGYEEKLLAWNWEKLLKPGGVFCLEWGLTKSQVAELPERVGFLVKIREKNYGDSVLTTYERAQQEASLGTDHE